jgi:hypothetical protein
MGYFEFRYKQEEEGCFAVKSSVTVELNSFGVNGIN